MISKCATLSKQFFKHLACGRKLFIKNSYPADKFHAMDDESSNDPPPRTGKRSLLDYTPKELEVLVEGPARVQQVWSLIRYFPRL
jgi:hypothetical protein